MKIKVKKTHIRRGVANSFDSCPIALAVTELICPSSNDNVHVSTEALQLGKAKIKLPKKAQSFINRFDDGKPVKPFQFEI